MKKNNDKPITLPVLTCRKCGYEWIPRQNDIRMCPNCKTTYWNEEKKQATK